MKRSPYRRTAVAFVILSLSTHVLATPTTPPHAGASVGCGVQVAALAETTEVVAEFQTIATEVAASCKSPAHCSDAQYATALERVFHTAPASRFQKMGYLSILKATWKPMLLYVGFLTAGSATGAYLGSLTDSPYVTGTLGAVFGGLVTTFFQPVTNLFTELFGAKVLSDSIAQAGPNQGGLFQRLYGQNAYTEADAHQQASNHATFLRPFLKAASIALSEGRAVDAAEHLLIAFKLSLGGYGTALIQTDAVTHTAQVYLGEALIPASETAVRRIRQTTSATAVGLVLETLRQIPAGAVREDITKDQLLEVTERTLKAWLKLRE